MSWLLIIAIAFRMFLNYKNLPDATFEILHAFIYALFLMPFVHVYMLRYKINAVYAGTLFVAYLFMMIGVLIMLFSIKYIDSVWASLGVLFFAIGELSVSTLHLESGVDTID